MTTRRIVTAPAEHLGPGDLPPGAPDGRLRLLVVTNHALGWRTYATSMAAITDGRDDVDAVHVRFEAPRAVAAFGARFPGPRQPTGVLDSHFRSTVAAKRSLTRWLRGVDLSRFDLIHVTPQFVAPAFVERPDRPVVTLGIDATATQAKAQRNGIGAAEVRRRFAPLLEVEARVLDAVDGIVSMNQWAVDDLPAGAASKAVVIPLSVPVIPLAASPPDTPVRLLFVGNDWERKGGPRLLEWHQRDLADVAELHVCSAAAPVDPAARNVVWHGAVPHDRLLAEIYPSVHALVLPTRSDMSPWAVVEAAALGVPVISSSIGAIGEVVDHEQTGFLLDPDDDAGFRDALRTIVFDETRRARLRAAAATAATERDHRVLGDRLVTHWRERAAAGPNRR